MAVAELPSINRLILIGNPLIRKDRGNNCGTSDSDISAMPFVQQRLVEARAITVVVEQQQPQKPPILIGRDFTQVSDSLYNRKQEIV